MSSSEMRSEQLDMVKHFYTEWEYRHTKFWELIYKTIFAIVFTMALPYFLSGGKVLPKMLWIFPSISCVLSVFSFLLLAGESARLTAIRKRMNKILYGVDRYYEEEKFEKSWLN